jgi:hypothetical protein
MRRLMMLFVCLLLAASQLSAQNRTIKGTVTDDKGIAIANASVVVKGTSGGTVTNANGVFSISVQAAAKTLVISSLNYASQEVAISGKNEITVKLESFTERLDEVVVTGYGTTKRVNSTASQARIGGKDIENLPVSSLDRGFQGKIAGCNPLAAMANPDLTRM